MIRAEKWMYDREAAGVAKGLHAHQHKPDPFCQVEANPMKALLQQAETGLYFRAPGEWTPEHEEAHDFKSSVTARTYCLCHGIEDVQIVLKFGAEKYDIVLDARGNKRSH